MKFFHFCQPEVKFCTYVSVGKMFTIVSTICENMTFTESLIYEKSSKKNWGEGGIRRNSTKTERFSLGNKSP